MLLTVLWALIAVGLVVGGLSLIQRTNYVDFSLSLTFVVTLIVEVFVALPILESAERGLETISVGKLIAAWFAPLVSGTLVFSVMFNCAWLKEKFLGHPVQSTKDLPITPKFSSFSSGEFENALKKGEGVYHLRSGQVMVVVPIEEGEDY